jgi:hypothetical protein
VDRQVKRDGDPGDGGRADELSVAEKGGGAMVIAVEEGCIVLARSSTTHNAAALAGRCDG